MAATLRTRLWLSFAFLILTALCIVAVGLILALQRNPILYRQTVQRLYVAGEAVTFRISEFPRLTNDRGEKIIEREATARSMRLALIDKNGTLEFDSGPGSGGPLPRYATPVVPTDADANLARIARSSDGKDWIYTIHTMDGERFLMAAVPLPVLRAREIFRDEIMGPFMQAALVALLLAVGLSLLLGQWISRPLKHMAEAAKRMETGSYQPVRLEGPVEVQQLGEALNEMSHRVQTSQQSQREFVANVSHELKTPLTSIQGFAQAILDGAAQTPEGLQQAATVIYNEAGRMHRMVLDLLSLARLEAGTADLQRLPISLPGLLQGIVDKFSLQAQQVRVELRSDLAQVPAIIGDGDRLTQVFSNLVDNALKFTPAGGRVTLCLRQNGPTVVVQVTDTGVGIAPEDQARIFERFYQVDRSRRGGSGRGIGLGLAIAAQIVAAHGGRIWVESQVGHGSTFLVSLPVPRSDDRTFDMRKGAI